MSDDTNLPDDDSEAGKRSWMIAPLERRAYSKALVRVEQEPGEGADEPSFEDGYDSGFIAGAAVGNLMFLVGILVLTLILVYGFDYRMVKMS